MHQIQKDRLEALYRKYNHREYVHPDPLEFLYRYDRPEDRELVGLVAASLAYGRVNQILISVSKVLAQMKPSPYRFIRRAPQFRIDSAFDGFVHRFATGADISRLMTGIRGVLDRHRSLHRAFKGFMLPKHETVLPALSRFCREIADAAGGDLGHLVPLPVRGSACKRMNLFLRWMVRKDSVDPGDWDDIPAAGLIIPLDVHMHRMGQQLGFTKRKQTNMQTAMEITNGFRQLSPEDPVRYDFSLTRLGIRGDAEAAARFSRQLNENGEAPSVFF